MAETVKVTIDGVTKEYRKGITFLEISKEYQKDYKDDIILAVQNHRLRELFKTVDSDCEIQFMTTKSDAGHKTYVRGMTLVMLKAFYDVLDRENIDNIKVEYSLGPGLYCDFNGKVKLTEDIILNVKKRMEELIQDDLPFLKNSVGTDDAIKLFESYGMYDKEKLFKYRRVSKANIYTL